eukprot:Nitzschia sp. Nitz4//scaffold114_size70088//62850//64498//NITZ4_005989-RA/size70088-processed-gene-0.46-mRNA-1//-1//CDS//3329533459//7700//frame0
MPIDNPTLHSFRKTTSAATTSHTHTPTISISAPSCSKIPTSSISSILNISDSITQRRPRRSSLLLEQQQQQQQYQHMPESLPVERSSLLLNPPSTSAFGASLALTSPQSSFYDNEEGEDDGHKPSSPLTMPLPISHAASANSKKGSWLPLTAWSLHFGLTLLVLSLPSWYGLGDRKYVPLDPSKLPDLACQTAFGNVFSSSMDEPHALVCCPSESPGIFMISHMCASPYYLAFATTLTRFPDAWLLPLFPLLLRLVYYLYRATQGHSSSITGDAWSTVSDNALARRRFFFYLGLIQFRVFVLYLGFDALEDRFWGNHSPDPTDTPGTCWHEPYLPSSNYAASAETCPGQTTDFSDHIVLFLAQILPIALLEVVYSFQVPVPYWQGRGESSNTTKTIWRPNVLVPLALIWGCLHLYLISFLAAYNTAAYFHTSREVVVGFLVSLIVQIPLCLLQCTNLFPRTKEYLFGTTTLLR